MKMKALLFASMTLAALCLGAPLAHLLELPNKLRLAGDEYLTVQQIYRGWAWLGALILGALASTALLVWHTYRKKPPVCAWAAVALVAMLLAQLIFWTLTYPVNQATRDWSTLPTDWSRLRLQWEYSHAAGAGLSVVAMLALIRAALAGSDEPPGPTCGCSP